jgi:5-methylcytosine-specific restriction endonuclease McrA
MKLTPSQRKKIRLMFGGRCAYCGIELNGKWHVDHVEAVRRETEYVHGQLTALGYTKTRATGKLYKPENDRFENLFPACVKCNILKSESNIEQFRQTLSYFCESIPRIATYSHVHHLMRFGKLTIDKEPVVFWFEKYRALQQ